MVTVIIVIAIIIVIIAFLIWLYIEDRSVKRTITERDKYIIDVLKNKYRNISKSELEHIHKELVWVCHSLHSEVYHNEDDRQKLILQGLYNPKYPVSCAKEKLYNINSRYGWTGENAVLFTTKTSSNGVYENRYFLNKVLNKSNCYDSFHFFGDEVEGDFLRNHSRFIIDYINKM